MEKVIPNPEEAISYLATGVNMKTRILLSGLIFLFVCSLCAAEVTYVDLVINSNKRAFVYPDQNLSPELIKAWKNYAERISYGDGLVLPSSLAADKLSDTTGVVILGNPGNNHIMADYISLIDDFSVSKTELRIGGKTFSSLRHPGLAVITGLYCGQSKDGGNRYALLCISNKDYPEIRKPIFTLAMKHDFLVSDIFGPLYAGAIDMSQETGRQYVIENSIVKYDRPVFQTAKSRHYQFFFPNDNLAKLDKGWLFNFQEKALARIKERLGLECETRIAFYLFNDKDQMAALTGSRGMGFADNFLPCVYAIYSDKVKGAIGAHEVTHVLLAEKWSQAYPGNLIDEGCAEFTALNWNSKPHVFWVKQFLQNNSLPTLYDLEMNWADYDSDISYPVAACFIAFLKETMGLTAVETLYKKAHKYSDAAWMKALLKQDPARLQKNFEKWLDSK